MTERKASEEIQKLANTLVQQAIEEGLSASELENLIRETRTNAGLKNRIPNMENLYREPTEKELNFKEKCYDFFKREITIEEATSRETKAHGHLISEEKFQRYLINFSTLMFAAKMLVNDNEKVTNQKIRDVLWSTGEYTNYTALLSDIGNASTLLLRIANDKRANSTWHFPRIAYHSSHTYRVVAAYFNFLEQQGIS